MIFQYPENAHVRRHAPSGYSNYQSYKPWLRDEFDFRCIYCLWRERWCAVGEAAFSVEHLHSQATAPERICDYDNMVYACCRCNSIKTDAAAILDPCVDAFSKHLQVHADGRIAGQSTEGRELIKACKLDEPMLTESRRRMLDLVETLQQSEHPNATKLLKNYLGFPSNPPRLSTLRPPGGNARPDGIAECYDERSRRGELSETY